MATNDEIETAKMADGQMVVDESEIGGNYFYEPPFSSEDMEKWETMTPQQRFDIHARSFVEEYINLHKDYDVLRDEANERVEHLYYYDLNGNRVPLKEMVEMTSSELLLRGIVKNG